MKFFHERRELSKIAILIGIVFSSIWAFVFITGMFLGNEPITLEGAILFAMAVLILLFVIYAIIRSEQVGGIVITILSIAMCIFSYSTAGRNKILAAIITGVPFFISGVLFLFNSQAKQ